LQIVVREHQTHVSAHERQQRLQLRVRHCHLADDHAHQGVLAHDEDGLAAEGDTDFLHLQRTDVVNADDEHIFVFAQKFFEL